MKSKFFEIRDIATRISVIAIKTEGENTSEIKFFDKNGWNNNSIILLQINGSVRAEYDSFNWRNGSRTMFEAHKYIEQNFDNLNNFEVIDIQFILGETDIKKVSEII